MSDALTKRIENACDAFYPAWEYICLYDAALAESTRTRMRAALAAGDPEIDLGITEAQADALARDAADTALDTLEHEWEIISNGIGTEWRDSALNAVAKSIRSILMALAKPAPKPKPTAQQLADTLIGGQRTCPKCQTKLPVGTYCKSFDCPLNPAEPPSPAVLGALSRGFVSVTPPQGGVGATQRL